MENWLNMRAMQMNQQLAEDVSAPELRNPLLWRYHRARKGDQAEIGITASGNQRASAMPNQRIGSYNTGYGFTTIE